MKAICALFLVMSVYGLHGQQLDCAWIEPDSSYIHPNPLLWPGSPGNADNYSSVINLGWEFHFFGQVYTQVILTTKGTIALGNAGYLDFDPSSFPVPLESETGEQHNHICGFWSDSDFGGSGDMYYKLTEEALYVNYVDVGYWPNQSDRTNTFQMIICANGSDVIRDGNNVQFFYKDMQWANSQINGASDGMNATENLAIVGCDAVTGNGHYSFGRFNNADDVYNGPYGIDLAGEADGLYWLNNRVIAFNTDVDPLSIPPGTATYGCNEVDVCDADYPYSILFVGSNVSQELDVELSGCFCNMEYELVRYPGAVEVKGSMEASYENAGVRELAIRATTDGIPAELTGAQFEFTICLSSRRPELMIFPNPVSDMMHITGFQSPMDITLIDATGREVLKATCSDVDLTHLANGNYLVRVIENNVAWILKVTVLKAG